jgi:hypothetical protein
LGNGNLPFRGHSGYLHAEFLTRLLT